MLSMFGNENNYCGTIMKWPTLSPVRMTCDHFSETSSLNRGDNVIFIAYPDTNTGLMQGTIFTGFYSFRARIKNFCLFTKCFHLWNNLRNKTVF